MDFECQSGSADKKTTENNDINLSLDMNDLLLGEAKNTFVIEYEPSQNYLGENFELNLDNNTLNKFYSADSDSDESIILLESANIKKSKANNKILNTLENSYYAINEEQIKFDFQNIHSLTDFNSSASINSKDCEMPLEALKSKLTTFEIASNLKSNPLKRDYSKVFRKEIKIVNNEKVDALESNENNVEYYIDNDSIAEKNTVNYNEPKKSEKDSNIYGKNDSEKSELTLNTDPIEKDDNENKQVKTSKFYFKIPCKIDDPQEEANHICEKCAYFCKIKGCNFITRFNNIFRKHEYNHSKSEKSNTEHDLKMNEERMTSAFVKGEKAANTRDDFKKIEEALTPSFVKSKKPAEIDFKKNKEKVTCQYCSYKAETFVLLVAHMQLKSVSKCDNSHPKSEVLVCGIEGCHFFTQDKNAFKNHKISEIHEILDIEKYFYRSYTCENGLCGFSTGNKNEMKDHKCSQQFSKQKNVNIIYTCKYCREGLTSKELCKTHIDTHKEIINDKSLSTKLFICANAPCIFETKSSEEFKSHIKQCKPDNIYKCQDCNYQAVDDVHLRKHEALHISVNLTCNFCFLQFPSKSEIHKHYFNKHTGPFDCIIYNCKYCWFKTPRYFELKSHYVEHHNATVEVFECPVCSTECQINFLVEYQIHFLQHIKR